MLNGGSGRSKGFRPGSWTFSPEQDAPEQTQTEEMLMLVTVSLLCSRMLFIVGENNIHHNSVVETKQHVRSVTLILAVSPQ